jgi:hypothetical protein
VAAVPATQAVQILEMVMLLVQQVHLVEVDFHLL